MNSVGVCRRRRFVSLREAICDGRKDPPLLRPPYTGAHAEHVGTQSHKRIARSVQGFENAIWKREGENTVIVGTFAK